MCSFFLEWNQQEWNKFYSYAFKCLQDFLNFGLMNSKIKNYEIKKLIGSTSSDFLDWLDENIKIGQEYIKKELFEKMKIDTDMEDMKLNTFTKNVKKWCKVREYQYNPHKNGEQDKRGKNDYMIIKK